MKHTTDRGRGRRETTHEFVCALASPDQRAAADETCHDDVMGRVNTVVRSETPRRAGRQRFSRRVWLGSAAAATAELLAGRASAAKNTPALAVRVGNPAVGALVAAVGETLVAVEWISSLPIDSIEIDGQTRSVTQRVLLKSAGEARGRFLDDARNATRVADNIREVLATADPTNANAFARAHQAWSRSFARTVFDWSQRLQNSPIKGQVLRDLHGRVYLLEWAGAKIDPKSSNAGPASLERLPTAAAKPTVAAYRAYIDKLVAALANPAP